MRKTISTAPPKDIIIMENKDSYGVNNLVNFGLCFKPIEDADKLLEECNLFIQEREADMVVLPFAAFSRVAAGVRNWRAKQRDAKLSVTYSTLLPRLLETEKTLRKIIGDVVEKKKSLRLQARYLQVRLNTCLQVNKDLLMETETPLEDIRSVIDRLSDESVRLKEMSVFNREILRLRLLSKNKRNKPYAGWGNSKQKPKTTVTESDLANDDDHSHIGFKLDGLRQLKNKYVKCLSEVLEKRVKEQMHIESCKDSLQAIETVVTREGWSSSADMGILTVGNVSNEKDMKTINNSNEGSNESNDESNYESTNESSSSADSGNHDGDSNRDRNSKVGNDDEIALSNNPNFAQVPYTFDHSRCRDCSYSHAITSDCTNHMATLQRQAGEANARLMELVMMRERMSSELAISDLNSSNGPHPVTSPGSKDVQGAGIRESMANDVGMEDESMLRESMSFNSSRSSISFATGNGSSDAYERPQPPSKR